MEPKQLSPLEQLQQKLNDFNEAKLCMQFLIEEMVKVPLTIDNHQKLQASINFLKSNISVAEKEYSNVEKNIQLALEKSKEAKPSVDECK